MEYKHGVYGVIAGLPVKQTSQTKSIAVYVGTAPAHLAQSSENVNKPLLLHSMQDAIAKLGYSEDWDKYSLCEAMDAHFNKAGVAPIVCINVLDPTKHRKTAKKTETLAPVDGVISIGNAESCILSTIAVSDSAGGGTTYTLGTDYNISYDLSKKKVYITKTATGNLPASAKVEYFEADATKVTTAELVGESDGAGSNTGIHAVADIYQLCEVLPSVILAPGFSHEPAVRAAMLKMSKQVAGHWDFMIYTDIPLADSDGEVGIAAAANWKKTKGYTADNEKVFYPMWKSAEGKKYHLSVLYMVNRQLLDAENGNIPYQSASNTEIVLPGKLYFGEGKHFVVNDDVVNKNLNAHGISSALFYGGRWVLWGTHTASYTPETKNELNTFDTGIQMLQFICNGFQERRADDIDKPMERNRAQQIVSEEQARLDALVSTGALIYGKASFAGYNANGTDRSDGNVNFLFEVTTSPLIKSLTANVSYTTDGLRILYGGN